MSETEVDEPPDAADVVRKKESEACAFAPNVPNGDPAGNGIHQFSTGGSGITQSDTDKPPDFDAVDGKKEIVDPGAPVRGLGAGAKDYTRSLFDVLEVWVFGHLRETLHADFLLSNQFQEYTRFLHVQHRPVVENDFILFRVLGRGGFGAVNGKMWNLVHYTGQNAEGKIVYLKVS